MPPEGDYRPRSKMYYLFWVENVVYPSADSDGHAMDDSRQGIFQPFGFLLLRAENCIFRPHS